MTHIAAVVAQIAADWGPMISQYGFGGILVWVIVKWLNRIEHQLRGLSKALWFDLASRPYSEPSIRAQAKKVWDQMEAEDLTRKRRG